MAANGTNEAAATGAAVTGTKAIDRALAVLSSFVDNPEQGITDISRQTSLSPSTVHRIVRALVASGYLEQDAATDQYRLGHSALILGERARKSLGLERARPVLDQLAALTGESVNLGVLDGSEVVVVARVESVQPLRFDQPVGSRIPAHCSSMGKALLAFSGQALPSMEFTKITSTTITTKTGFKAELAEAAARGYTVDNEESIAGVSCVAAPILNANGHAAAAIAVQAPTVRMSAERSAALGKQTMAAADQVRLLLGLETLSSIQI